MKQILRMLMVGSVAIAIGATASASTCLATQDVTLTIGTPKTVTLTNSYQMGSGSWSYQSVSPYSGISVAIAFKLQDGTTLPSSTMNIWLDGGATFSSGGSGSGSFSWNSSTPMSYSNPVTEMVLTATSSTATGNVTVRDLSLTSSMGCTQPVSSSSSSSSSTPATASASIVQSDATRVTRSAVTANNSMMSQGLERFIGDREANDLNVSRSFNSFSFLPTLNANDDGIFGGGSFFAQSGSADAGYRQVTFGEFDVQHESGSGTTLSFNGRTAWERAVNDDAMIAYFLGAEINQSNIKGSYSGDQTRYGVTAGMYGYMALENDLYLSGYGSFGVGRSDLDITDGASSVITGDYSSRTASIGGKLSGSVDYDTYELRPSVGLNMVKTWIGDITLDDSGSALTSSVGDTTFAELIAKPEFIFPMEQQAGSNMIPVASAAPRLICERNDASGVVTSDCGGGVEFGVKATSEDGATNLNATVRFDRLGSVNRQGLNLQAELRF